MWLTTGHLSDLTKANWELLHPLRGKEKTQILRMLKTAYPSAACHGPMKRTQVFEQGTVHS